MATPTLLGVLIDRYRCVRSAWIPIAAGQVTVLVGPNDSGKSTILRGIAAVFDPPADEEARAAAFYRTEREFGEIEDIVQGDEAGHHQYAWLSRTTEIQEWLEAHDSALELGVNPIEGWGLWSVRDSSDASTVDKVQRAATTKVVAVSAYGPGRPGTATRWLAAEAPVLVDEPPIEPPADLRELTHPALAREYYNTLLRLAGEEELPADFDVTKVREVPAREELLEATTALRQGGLDGLGENRRRRRTLADILVLPLATDIPALDVFVPVPARGHDLERYLARSLSAWVRSFDFSGIPGREWYRHTDDLGRIQELHDDISSMLTIVGDWASEMLPPFLSPPDGPKTWISIDAEEQDDIRVRVSRRGRPPVRLDDLAEGFRLWIGLAVVVAAHGRISGPIAATAAYPPRAARALEDEVYDVDGGSLTVLIDEPERHLHPHVQRQAAKWLASFAAEHGVGVVMATHSAPFLAIGDATYIDVTRPDETTRVRLIDPLVLADQRDVAARLGFDRGGLSELVEMALMVEGAHDEIVLEAWFGAELRRAGVLLVPFRGTTKLEATTLSLETLLRFVDLRIAFLFDTDPQIDPAVELAQALAASPPTRWKEIWAERDPKGKLKKRKGAFIDLIAFGTVEDRYVVPGPRPPVWTHAYPDIVFHLAEQHYRQFAPKYTRDAALAAYLETSSETNGKAWLRGQYGLPDDFFSEASVERMVRDSVPTGNLNEIVDEICAAAVAARAARLQR